MKLKKCDKNLQEEWLRAEETLEHELNCDAGDHTTCLASGFALIAESLSRICRCLQHTQSQRWRSPNEKSNRGRKTRTKWWWYIKNTQQKNDCFVPRYFAFILSNSPLFAVSWMSRMSRAHYCRSPHKPFRKSALQCPSQFPPWRHNRHRHSTSEWTNSAREAGEIN